MMRGPVVLPHPLVGPQVEHVGQGQPAGAARRLLGHADACPPAAAHAVGPGHQLHRVHGLGPGLLQDRPVGQVAVAAHGLVAGRLDLAAQWSRHLAGQLVVLGPVAPGPVDARAALHDGALHARRLEEVPAAQPGVLGLQVAGHVVRHRVGHRAVGPAGELVAQGERVVGVAVAAHQVLGRVEGVRGDQVGVRTLGVDRVVPLHDVGAGRLGHDDVAPGPHLGGEGGHVAASRLVNSSTRPECSHGAPQHLVPSGEAAGHAVVLVDLHDGPADIGLHVLHEAGGEHRHRCRCPSAPARPPPLLEPRREALLGIRRQQSLRRQADRLLHDPAGQRARCAGRPVDHRRSRDRDPPRASVRPRNWSVSRSLSRHDLLLAHRVHPAHQAREVELPLVWRHVGALHVAELALVALVDDLVALGVGQGRRRPRRWRR